MKRTDSGHRVPKPIYFDGILQKLYGLKALDAEEQPQGVYSKLIQLHNQHGVYSDGMLIPEDTTQAKLDEFLRKSTNQLLQLPTNADKTAVAVYSRDSRNNVWLLHETLPRGESCP